MGFLKTALYLADVHERAKKEVTFQATLQEFEKDIFTGGLSVSHVGRLGEYPLSDYQSWFGPLPLPR